MLFSQEHVAFEIVQERQCVSPCKASGGGSEASTEKYTYNVALRLHLVARHDLELRLFGVVLYQVHLKVHVPISSDKKTFVCTPVVNKPFGRILRTMSETGRVGLVRIPPPSQCHEVCVALDLSLRLRIT